MSPTAEAPPLPANLLASKLLPFAADPRAILRDGLRTRIERERSPVTLIVAPAGSGKSTLMAQLQADLARRHVPACWLSLDAEDDDPATFALYFIAALNAIEPGFAHDEQVALEANPLRDFDPLFDRLIGRLAASTLPRAIFLDDFQHLRDARILRFLDRLLAHLPAGLQFVIASRVVPPLQLARLRVAGRVADVGQDELNFDREQARLFLARYHDLRLAPGELDALLDSTEGWPTGVQLAALALRHHDGPALALIRTFSGRDRDLTRYLVESVLRGEPAEVREFLLRSSPLRRLCADLCVAATGQRDAAERIDYVARANLFLAPLDRSGHWYRYHHLFAEFLQNEFRRADPEGYRQVCDRAARWCEANGQPAEAIRYALDAEHYDDAAVLIARHAPQASMHRGDHYTVRDWLRRLPAGYHDRHPELLLAHAWSCAFSRSTAQALQLCDEALAGIAQARWPLSREERQRCTTLARTVQAATQACSDDIDDCIHRAEALRDQVGDGQPFVIATLSNCLGYGHLIRRDSARSREAAADAHQYGHRADAGYLSAWGSFIHGLADVELGRLREAELCGRGVRADSQGLALAPGLGQRSYVAGLSALLDAEIALQRCQFERVEASVAAGRAFKEIFGPVEPQLVALRNEARLLAHRGRLDDARIVLQEGQEAALRERYPRLSLALAIEETALQLLASDLPGAQETARKWRLREGGGPPRLRSGLLRAQRDALQLLDARLLLGDAQPGAALRLLTALQQGSGAELQGGFSLSVTVHRAIALWQTGKGNEALRQLDHALETAAGEFHAWPLASAGRGLLPLLDALSERRSEADASPTLRSRLALQDWLQRWLRGERETPRGTPELTPTTRNPAAQQALLTDQEVKLLRLLQSGLNNRRLADSMLLSESTVKWHLHNIYGKLAVKSRGEAVAQAMEAGII